MNEALLDNWFWKLETESALWQSVLSNKKFDGGCLSRAKTKLGTTSFGLAFSKLKIYFTDFQKQF